MTSFSLTQAPAAVRTPVVLSRDLARPAAHQAAHPAARPGAWPYPAPEVVVSHELAGRVFVGRQRELDVLAGLMASAAAGTPQLALIEAEAGLGKSALIREFLAGHRAVPVLAASGDAAEQALPYCVVRQLVSGAAGGLLAGCPILAAGPAADADPLAVGAELQALLSARPGACGLAVVIEDLHWADSQSARALLFACRRLAAGQALVVVSGRPGGLRRLGDGWARLLQAERDCRRLTLGRLGRPELAVLATALGRGTLPGSALRHVADYSQGSPLLARALLTEVPDHVLSGPPSQLTVPESLSAVILPRLASLRADSRDLVIAAAVLGECCALADAALLAGVQQADDALDLAAEAGFLVAEPAHRRIRFAHELVRRAVYGDIGTAMRRSLHRWAATLTDGPDALGHRAAAAGGPDLQLALELDAAAAAAAAATAAGHSAPSLAAGYLIQAAELGARGPERARRVLAALELFVRTADAAGAGALRPLAEQLPAGVRRDAALGQLAMMTARPAAAEALLLAAWEGYQRASRPADGAGAVVASCAAAASVAGCSARADDAGADDAAAADAAAAEAAAGLAVLCANAGASADAGKWARLSVLTARDDRPGYPAVLAMQAMACALAGQTAAATQLLSCLPAAAPLVPAAHCDALTARGLLRLSAGDVQAAADDLAAVVTRIRAGLPVRQPGAALGYLAEADFRLGRWDDAQQHAELAICLARDADRASDLPLAYCAGTPVAALRGEWEVASARVVAAQEAARAFGAGSAVAYAAAARSWLGFARDDPDEVLSATARLLTTAGTACHCPAARLWRPMRIWALIRTGALEAAGRALDELDARAAAGGDDSVLVHGGWLRASLALARNAPEAAWRVLDDCSARADSLPDPLARALLQIESGRCLTRLHKRPAALSRLRSGFQILTALRARPLAERAEAELAALGMRVRPDADSCAPDLTAQELQVARLVAGGMSNREAAAVLYLSPKTIEYHLAHIFAKLGIRTRYQLAARLRSGERPGLS